MSMWAEQGLLDKVTEILADVDWDHHFGRPFVTAYQLAIELQHRYPDVVEAIDRPVGGVETGQRNSLAQYLANQLSRAIKADPSFPVEGAGLWGGHMSELVFVVDGRPVRSSLVGTPYPLSMFRLRD